MQSRQRPYVAREGWIFIAIALAVAAVLQFLLGMIVATPFWMGSLLLIYLFRDPVRDVPSSPLGVVCPVDGKIRSITVTKDPFLDRDAIQIFIKMSRFGPYFIRSPAEGKIVRQWVAGDAGSEITKIDPRANFAMWVQTDEQDDVTVIVRGSIFGMRPYYFMQAGQRVGQGQRFGMLRFGSKVFVYIPVSSRILSNQGDQVSGGTDIIGSLMHTSI